MSLANTLFDYGAFGSLVMFPPLITKDYKNTNSKVVGPNPSFGAVWTSFKSKKQIVM
jgi:hypothetical protein